MREKLSPCIYRSDSMPLAVDFHCRDGRVHGFPYNHLLRFLHEINPDADRQPNAPAERFLFSFSTHDVVLLGWSLQGLVPLLCLGQLASVRATEVRYLAAAGSSPFVSDISIHSASQI